MKSLILAASLITVTAAGATVTPADAVLAAEQARRSALLAGDTTVLSGLLSNELRYTHSNGKFEDKAAVIQGFLSKQVAYERFDLSQLHAQVITPEVVVVSGTINQRKLGGGKWSDARLLFQAVWRNESGAWRLASLQTVMPPAAAAAAQSAKP